MIKNFISHTPIILSPFLIPCNSVNLKFINLLVGAKSPRYFRT